MLDAQCSLLDARCRMLDHRIFIAGCPQITQMNTDALHHRIASHHRAEKPQIAQIDADIVATIAEGNAESQWRNAIAMKSRCRAGEGRTISWKGKGHRVDPKGHAGSMPHNPTSFPHVTLSERVPPSESNGSPEETRWSFASSAIPDPLGPPNSPPDTIMLCEHRPVPRGEGRRIDVHPLGGLAAGPEGPAYKL